MKEASNNTKTCDQSDLAIIESDKGIIVSDNEAVHYLYDNAEEGHEVNLYDRKEGSISIFPSSSTLVPVKELKKCECRESTLTDFVRRFGSRIEGNYSTLLDSIREIGLNPEDYKREVEHA